MITAYVHQGGETARYGAVDPRWLDPAAGATPWVDLEAPTGDELRVLTDVFHLHQLAVDDARSSLQFPKVEDYQRFVYLVLHAMDVPPGQATVATRDVDFFVGPTYLATVHDGASRTVADVRSGCERHAHFMSEGPVGVLHRVVDALVDNYRPAIDALDRAVERVEEEAFASRGQVVRRILRLRRELAAVRRVLIPQRDAVGRLARREFPLISDEMAYRFRDVYDHVIRLADEVMLLQDRMTGIQEVNLAAISNRLNQVMKVLTVMSTIFLPLTVVTGLWGMNVRLPVLPGGEAMQFWWMVGGMAAIAGVMLGLFRRNGWI